MLWVRRWWGLGPVKMDLAGTIILLCSCAAGAGGEERPGPPGPAGSWPAALARGCRPLSLSPSFPPFVPPPSLARLGAGGGGPRSPGRRASAPRRQAAAGPPAGALLFAARSRARSAPSCPGPRPAAARVRPSAPTHCPGLCPAEDRTGQSRLFSPSSLPGPLSPPAPRSALPSPARLPALGSGLGPSGLSSRCR